jgi:hypothetical protein
MASIRVFERSVQGRRQTVHTTGFQLVCPQTILNAKYCELQPRSRLRAFASHRGDMLYAAHVQSRYLQAPGPAANRPARTLVSITSWNKCFRTISE